MMMMMMMVFSLVCLMRDGSCAPFFPLPGELIHVGSYEYSYPVMVFPVHDTIERDGGRSGKHFHYYRHYYYYY